MYKRTVTDTTASLEIIILVMPVKMSNISQIVLDIKENVPDTQFNMNNLNKIYSLVFMVYAYYYLTCYRLFNRHKLHQADFIQKCYFY